MAGYKARLKAVAVAVRRRTPRNGWLHATGAARDVGVPVHSDLVRGLAAGNKVRSGAMLVVVCKGGHYPADVRTAGRYSRRCNALAWHVPCALLQVVSGAGGSRAGVSELAYSRLLIHPGPYARVHALHRFATLPLPLSAAAAPSSASSGALRNDYIYGYGLGGWGGSLPWGGKFEDVVGGSEDHVPDPALLMPSAAAALAGGGTGVGGSLVRVYAGADAFSRSEAAKALKRGASVAGGATPDTAPVELTRAGVASLPLLSPTTASAAPLALLAPPSRLPLVGTTHGVAGLGPGGASTVARFPMSPAAMSTLVAAIARSIAVAAQCGRAAAADDSARSGGNDADARDERAFTAAVRAAFAAAATTIAGAGAAPLPPLRRLAAPAAGAASTNGGPVARPAGSAAALAGLPLPGLARTTSVVARAEASLLSDPKLLAALEAAPLVLGGIASPDSDLGAVLAWKLEAVGRAAGSPTAAALHAVCAAALHARAPQSVRAIVDALTSPAMASLPAAARAGLAAMAVSAVSSVAAPMSADTGYASAQLSDARAAAVAASLAELTSHFASALALQPQPDSVPTLSPARSPLSSPSAGAGGTPTRQTPKPGLASAAGLALAGVVPMRSTAAAAAAAALCAEYASPPAVAAAVSAASSSSASGVASTTGSATTQLSVLRYFDPLSAPSAYFNYGDIVGRLEVLPGSSAFRAASSPAGVRAARVLARARRPFEAPAPLRVLPLAEETSRGDASVARDNVSVDGVYNDDLGAPDVNDNDGTPRPAKVRRRAAAADASNRRDDEMVAGPPSAASAVARISAPGDVSDGDEDAEDIEEEEDEQENEVEEEAAAASAKKAVPRLKWSASERIALMEGLARHGRGSWGAIVETHLPGRTVRSKCTGSACQACIVVELRHPYGSFHQHTYRAQNTTCYPPLVRHPPTQVRQVARYFAAHRASLQLDELVVRTEEADAGMEPNEDDAMDGRDSIEQREGQQSQGRDDEAEGLAGDGGVDDGNDAGEYSAAVVHEGDRAPSYAGDVVYSANDGNEVAIGDALYDANDGEDAVVGTSYGPNDGDDAVGDATYEPNNADDGVGDADYDTTEGGGVYAGDDQDGAAVYAAQSADGYADSRPGDETDRTQHDSYYSGPNDVPAAEEEFDDGDARQPADDEVYQQQQQQHRPAGNDLRAGTKRPRHRDEDYAGTEAYDCDAREVGAYVYGGDILDEGGDGGAHGDAEWDSGGAGAEYGVDDSARGYEGEDDAGQAGNETYRTGDTAQGEITDDRYPDGAAGYADDADGDPVHEAAGTKEPASQMSRKRRRTVSSDNYGTNDAPAGHEQEVGYDNEYNGGDADYAADGDEGRGDGAYPMNTAADTDEDGGGQVGARDAQHALDGVPTVLRAREAHGLRFAQFAPDAPGNANHHGPEPE